MPWRRKEQGKKCKGGDLAPCALCLKPGYFICLRPFPSPVADPAMVGRKNTVPVCPVRYEERKYSRHNVLH